MLGAGLVGILVSVPCLIFVVSNWAACGGCNRPLREWIVVHCALHMIQSPIRLALYYRLVCCGTVIGEQMRLVTASVAWRASKVLSIFTYGLLIVGVVWLLNARSETCPGILRLCAVLLSLSVVKMIFTFSMFRHTFVQRQAEQAEESSDAPKGASESLINALPSFLFGSAHSAGGGSETGCAVCLAEFERGDLLRQLPCGHKFHSTCIDKWLRTKKVCPLCMQDIESTLCSNKSCLHKKAV